MGLTSDFYEWPGRLIAESGYPNACCPLEPAGMPIHTSRPMRTDNVAAQSERMTAFRLVIIGAKPSHQ